MKKDKGLLWFYIVLIVSILMVNPPILNLVNSFCIVHPQTFGWPTLFLWLEFWYAVMIIDFVVSAVRLRAWDCSQDEKTIVPVKESKEG